MKNAPATPHRDTHLSDTPDPARSTQVLRVKGYPVDAALAAAAGVLFVLGAVNPWGYVFGADSTLGATDLGARNWMIAMIVGGLALTVLALAWRNRAFIALLPVAAVGLTGVLIGTSRVSTVATELYQECMTGSAGGRGVTIVAYGLLLATVALVAGTWRTIAEARR